MFGWLRHLLRIGIWYGGRVIRRWRRPPAWIFVLVEGDMPELPAPRPPIWQRPFHRPELSLSELRERLRAIASDPRVIGVVIHLRPLDMGAARVQTLREDIAALRGAGKRAVAWATSYTSESYLVACACDEILLSPGGTVGVLGLRSPHLYLADVLARVGLEVEVVRVSPYKTAADALVARTMSAEAREMADWLADSALDEQVEAIAAGRRRSAAEATAIIDAGLLVDEDALAAGAVDCISSEEGIPGRLGSPHPLADWGRARRALPRPRPVPPGSHIALLRLEGTIVDGRSQRPPLRPPIPIPVLGGPRAGDLSLVQAIRAATADPRAKAAVLFVDSPGGSSTASEAISAALAELAAAKPLVVAMGDLAASGGYYVAAPAHWIVARPGTLTGSIGVIGLKVVTSGLLALAGANRVEITRGANAGALSDGHRYTERERALMERVIGRTYEIFLRRVAAGRRLDLERVRDLAGGRVFTGAQAIPLGLVDAGGGIEAALAKARELAGIDPRRPHRTFGPGRHWLAPEPRPSVAAHLLAGLALVRHTSAWCISPVLPGG